MTKPIPRRFAIRSRERADHALHRYDWLVVGIASDVNNAKHAIAELESYRAVARQNFETLNQMDTAIVQMLDKQGLNTDFAIETKTHQ